MTISKVWMATWLAAGSAGCCFGNRTPPPPPSTEATPGAQTALTLAPGFAPDPTIVTGTAGGMVAASTMGPTCVGSIASAPNVVITTTAPFSTLRFVVSASQDTTLVVHLANGQVLCDDDSGGSLNPAATAAVPPGRHEIYVGEYNRSSVGTPFRLGITTSATVDSTMVSAGLQGGIPTACGLREAVFGPLQPGTMVTLAVHSPYTGPDGQGHIIGPADEGALNWAPAMQTYVSQRTVITGFAGLDTAGCPIARVAADGGQFTWRIRDMHL